jgi:hypothetical protein
MDEDEWIYAQNAVIPLPHTSTYRLQNTVINFRGS